jgi:hypothetical protein
LLWEVGWEDGGVVEGFGAVGGAGALWWFVGVESAKKLSVVEDAVGQSLFVFHDGV